MPLEKQELLHLFNPSAIQPFQVESEEIPSSKSRKVANVRLVKKLFNNIDQTVQESLKKVSERSKKYVVPASGAAITDTQFIQKLNALEKLRTIL